MQTPKENTDKVLHDFGDGQRVLLVGKDGIGLESSSCVAVKTIAAWKRMHATHTSLLAEIDTAVTEINGSMFSFESSMPCPELEFHSNGLQTIIKWAGITLWSSEDDDRPFNEDEDEYMPMETFLRGRLSLYIERLSIINQKKNK